MMDIWFKIVILHLNEVLEDAHAHIWFNIVIDTFSFPALWDLAWGDYIFAQCACDMHMLTMAWTQLCFLVQCHSDACYGRCYVYTCKCYQSSSCTWVCDGFPLLWPKFKFLNVQFWKGRVWHSFHHVACRYNPVTDLDTGLQKFVKWYKSYYREDGGHSDMLNGYKPY